jgi:hypothetical protein
VRVADIANRPAAEAVERITSLSGRRRGCWRSRTSSGRRGR